MPGYFLANDITKPAFVYSCESILVRSLFFCFEETGKPLNINVYYIYLDLPRSESFCLLLCSLRSEWKRDFIIGSHFIV